MKFKESYKRYIQKDIEKAKQLFQEGKVTPVDCTKYTLIIFKINMLGLKISIMVNLFKFIGGVGYED